MIKIVIAILVSLILLPFLAANIYFSQNHDPLLFNVLEENDIAAGVKFLTKIKRQKDFGPQLKYFEDLYSEDLSSQVFREEKRRKEEIKRLEIVLEKNSNARDILLNLAILNYLDENLIQSKTYYLRAKAIDPEVKIEELEKII